MKINLFDHEFIHTENLLGYITCSDRLKPKKIEWVNGKIPHSGITIFTDRYINNPIIHRSDLGIKIFLLLEPPEINCAAYDNIVHLENCFDYILTYDEQLLSRGSKYIRYVVGQSRVYDNEAKIYDKSKFCSLIASEKNKATGHALRHEVAQKLSNKHNIDLWGRKYRYFDNKTEPLADYLFSISITNSKKNNYFTEVLLDNFRVGTVPIFWGCPNIAEFFDIDGIITFNDLEELDLILSKLSKDDYDKMLPHIKNNFELVKKYVSTDDLIADILIQKNIWKN